jgi:hypothetical protein
MCPESYHATCHEPHITDQEIRSDEKWFCCKCRNSDANGHTVTADDSIIIDLTRDLEADAQRVRSNRTRDRPTFDPRIDDSWGKAPVLTVVKLRRDVGLKGLVAQWRTAAFYVDQARGPIRVVKIAS